MWPSPFQWGWTMKNEGERMETLARALRKAAKDKTKLDAIADTIGYKDRKNMADAIEGIYYEIGSNCVCEYRGTFAERNNVTLAREVHYFLLEYGGYAWIAEWMDQLTDSDREALIDSLYALETWVYQIRMKMGEVKK